MLPKQISKLDAAKLLSISRVTLDKRIVAGDYTWPPGDLPALVAEHVLFEKSGQLSGDARKALEIEKVRRLKLLNEQTERGLIPFSDAELVVREASAIFAGQMSSLPGRLANELAGISDPGVVRDRIRLEVTRIRKAVADRFQALGEIGRHKRA